MSIREAFFESLPYIDPEPTESESLAAQSLIDTELSLTHTHPRPPHPSLPPTSPPTFTPTIQSLLAAKEPLSAIDLTRYQTQDPLPSGATPEEAEHALKRAYASQSYLAAREVSLELLDEHGKNAWLVGNHHLEALLGGLEAELARARADVDRLALERRRAQDEVAGEMRSLEDAWRKGVARTLEAEVAVEGLRREIRERMRERLAAGGS